MNQSATVSETQSKAWGRMLVLVAGVLWSTGGFFAKAPYFDGWPGPLMAFWRATFACLILIPMIRRPAWSWKMLPMMVTFALMNYTYLTSLKLGSATNAIWLQNTAPVWVLIVGVFAFRESAQRRDWLLILFTAAGTSVILFFESQGKELKAVLYGLASGLFYAGVVLSLRHLREFDSAWLVALNHIFTAIVLSPFMLESFGTAHWPTGFQWWLLIGFGVLQMGFPYFLFARGLRLIPGHEASGVGLVEPLLVPVWVLIAWGDKPAWWTLLGGGLILLGLLLRFLSEVRRSPALPK